MDHPYFFTLSQASEGFLKDRGSKFHAFAYPVRSVEEVEEHLASLRKQFYDARHHCTAYRLGKEGEETYTHDDGEPGNTAGAPILAAIRSANLTWTAIIVVRYFGGTKLGVRGLIDAYRGAAENAISQAELLEIIPKVIFSLHFSYPQTSEVNRVLHRFETEERSSSYTDTCELVLAIKQELFPALQAQLDLARITYKVQNEEN